MSEDKITLDLDLVEVKRSKDSVIGGEYPAHEIEVLKVIHRNGDGTSKVTVLEKGVADKEVSDNADTEYARLLKAYNRVNAANPVPVAFPGGAADLTKFGFKQRGMNAKANTDSISRDNRKKASEDKKAAAAKKSDSK